LTVLNPDNLRGLTIERSLDLMTDAFVLLDRDWNIVYANHQTGQAVGRSVDQIIGRNHWQEFQGLEGTELERRYHFAVKSGQSQHFDYYYAALEAWYEIHVYPSELGLAIYFRRITDRKLAEDAIASVKESAKRTERAYLAALSNTPDLVYVFDLEHRFTYANQALLRMWGRTWDDAIGKNCLELGYPDWHAAMHDREIEEVIATREPIKGEVPFTGTHGRRMYEYIFVPVIGANGDVEAVAGTTRDVTESRAAGDAILKERHRLAELFRQAPVFIAVLRGPEHIFELTNRQYLELIGNRNVLGKSLREAIPETVEQGFVAILDRVYQTGEPFLGHNQLVRLSRSPGQPLDDRYLDFVYQPMREADESISGIMVLGVDITERRRMESALMQSEKLAAVGRLSASIAHEINNPLEAVTNLLYLIGQSPDLSDSARDFTRMAQQELARVSQIATQTLRFYRQSTARSEVKISDLLDSVLKLYQGRLTSAGVEVQRDYRTSQPFLCFEGELRQVFTNLIGNALDASRNGGKIILRSSTSTDWSTGRKGVRITVADSGHGMSRDVARRIFEPFFSTKGMTGTGLGLWVSLEIIQKHNGRIKVRSNSSAARHGTVFTIFIPQ
jgi:PAS domain S-box-containing protein